MTAFSADEQALLLEAAKPFTNRADNINDEKGGKICGPE